MTTTRGIVMSAEDVRAMLDGRIVFNDDLLRRMHGSGMTIKEIAEAAGCSRYPVGKALKRLGLRRPAKRRPGVGVGSDNPAWTGGRRVRRHGIG